jgi:RNA polymerase sigma-70 factor (ECF subfamily)
MFNIASNYIIDYWRKKKLDTFSIDRSRIKENDRFTFEISSDDPPVCAKYEVAELREKVERALNKIPPHFRELFVWRHINQFSYEEIAELKGLPVGTVKNRVFQSKELIRRHLEEKE